ncbi:budC, partial [Symbiodinium sp. KB8]
FPVRAAEEPPADTVGQWAFYIPIDRRLPQRASGDWIVAGGVVIEQLCHGDERLISPFQNCLVDEIMANAAGSINVLTERDPAMLPNSGYHCSLFAKYPLAGISRSSMASRSGSTGCSEFREYRSDFDLSVQQQFCDEVLIRTANEVWFRPTVVISVFVGWKVSVTSFEVGARVYSIGPRQQPGRPDLKWANVCAGDVADQNHPGVNNAPV